MAPLAERRRKMVERLVGPFITFRASQASLEMEVTSARTSVSSPKVWVAKRGRTLVDLEATEVISTQGRIVKK